ncbi:Mrp/NBP35 family ATP-binding protein [Desulfotomaculum copahuensis]|uniref:Iron-sulfur cluster carrier protein n=1 Tax=Desulfotomaculum copahuensis TaxID=1838280 RepID=A0A1B7LI53_9FIRM|nr:Mrp/NBP35 family ATP-binding protein [Desulfotomaculum copahuensis]OAT85938.1 DNA-binding protein [Desulfotomaculum copahuensis]
MANNQCESCKDKTGQCSPESCGKSLLLPQNEASEIKHVIGVMSGKGGVGKSSVSALLAVSLARAGYKVGIMDADITGPSIPRLFGLKARPEQFNEMLLPVKTALGIEVMSLNLLLPEEDDPVIWRGPILASAVKQFWSDVAWGRLDYLIVDMPPGTGDVPLTVLQSLPLDGLIVVSSPQDLAMMVVKKAIKMVQQVHIPVLGLVENMSYLACPHCGERIHLFGSGHVADAARANDLRLLDVLPLDPELAALGDAGKIEEYSGKAFNIDPVLTITGEQKKVN